MTNRTTDEWQEEIGAQIRGIRIRRRIEQTELAALANVSVGAIKSLEGGKGSSLRTFIRVLRALEHTDFLQSLQPAVTISPLDVVRTGKFTLPSRVVKPRKK